jgi:myo-inositol-1(or 4)-monophosphatase
LMSPLLELVKQASELAIALKKDGLSVELKPDGSLVTQVDQEVERFLRPRLVELLPESVVWGEEYGQPDQLPDELWLIDPVDGTSNFAFGSPIWGITVALTTPDAIELGVICLPELTETYWAVRDGGAFVNGSPVKPIPPGPIQEHELVSYNETVIRGHLDQPIPGKMRCSGAVVIDAAFTVMQRYRGFIGMKECLYDDAAGMLLGIEAGADVRYANGDPLDIAQLRQGGKLKPWVIFPKDSGFFLNRTIG